MRTIRDADSGKVDAAGSQSVHFLEHRHRVKGNAVADDAERALVENARWHEAKLVFFTACDDSMTGIAAALKANDGLCLLCEVVDNLALALVAPLRSGYYYGWHDFISNSSYSYRKA